MSHTLSDEGEVVDDETFARDSAQGVAVITVPGLIKQCILVNVACVVETSKSASNPLVGEEGGETRGANQEKNDALKRRVERSVTK